MPDPATIQSKHRRAIPPKPGSDRIEPGAVGTPDRCRGLVQAPGDPITLPTDRSELCDRLHQHAHTKWPVTEIARRPGQSRFHAANFFWRSSGVASVPIAVPLRAPDRRSFRYSCSLATISIHSIGCRRPISRLEARSRSQTAIADSVLNAWTSRTPQCGPSQIHVGTYSTGA